MDYRKHEEINQISKVSDSKNNNTLRHPLISVIIPVYNGQDTIVKTCESLRLQTFKEFEVIIVNDGSTDKTQEVCNELCQSDERFRIIKKPNGGVSSARNRGLEESRGCWIAFVDADDKVLPQYLEDLYKRRSEGGIVIQGLTKVARGRDENRLEFPEREIFLNSESHKLFEYTHLILGRGFPVAKLFDYEIIKKHSVRFNENIKFAEDLIFLLSYLLYANKVVYIPGSNYLYYIDNSIGSLKLNSFKNEYALLSAFENIIAKIQDKFSMSVSQDILGTQSIFVSRCIYSLYCEHHPIRFRLKTIKDLQDKYKLLLRDHYNPTSPIIRINKFLFMHIPVVFDLFCSLIFKYK